MVVAEDESEVRRAITMTLEEGEEQSLVKALAMLT
jgi:hypothetical protein